MSLVKLCLLMQNFHAFFVILTLLFFQNDFLILYSYFVFNGGRYHLLARGFYDQILLRSYSGLQSKKATKITFVFVVACGCYIFEHSMFDTKNSRAKIAILANIFAKELFYVRQY